MTYRRPSETLYEETENTPEKNGQEWLLLYDFEGVKLSTKFYTNLTSYPPTRARRRSSSTAPSTPAGG